MSKQVDCSTPSDLEMSDLPPYQIRADITHIVSEKPIVVPQSTSFLFIKTLSPFARCYSPALAQLSNPINQEEFLDFIDGLNKAFLSHPTFQAAHVAGAALMGTQMPPALLLGGVLQVTSVLASEGVSFIRVRKFMKSANATIFAPRGLVAKIQTTEKMMAAVNFTSIDSKGKLKLPPLDDVYDLRNFNPTSTREIGSAGEVLLGPEDPRILRLRALEGYVSPLTFEVPENPVDEGRFTRMGQAPLRWANKRQMKKLEKAKAKSLKKREKYSVEVEQEEAKARNEIAEIERMTEGAGESELLELERAKIMELQKRDAAIASIYQDSDKKINKAYREEEKVANRVLWIVISKADGSDEDSLFRVGTSMSV